MGKRGLLYTIAKKDLIKIIDSSNSIAEVLEKIGYSKVGSGYTTFKKRATADHLDLSGLNQRAKDKAKSRLRDNKYIPFNELKSTGSVKKRIIREELLKYKCSECSITHWKEKKLSLHLDHINGDNKDHRIENLRFLCPNCHSQTDTYCGRNKKKLVKNRCLDCKESIGIRSVRCRPCSFKNRSTKIKWPALAKLIELVEESNYSAVGRKLGVSDNAVRKRIESLKGEPCRN